MCGVLLRGKRKWTINTKYNVDDSKNKLVEWKMPKMSALVCMKFWNCEQ